MRDPLDILGRYFYEIIGCWGVLMAISFLWIGFQVTRALREKRRQAK